MIIGTGVDIVEIGRMKSIFERRSRIIERILTNAEREHMPPDGQRQLEYLCGRFAAKEAFSKAIGTGIGASLGWHDISVLRGEYGQPIILLHHQRFQSPEWRERKIHLSIAHERHYVISFVIIEQC
jgi:holo-[acyl-carrier protein] synthase